MIRIWILDDHPDRGPFLRSALSGPVGVETTLFTTAEAALAAEGAPDLLCSATTLGGQPVGPEVADALRLRNLLMAEMYYCPPPGFVLPKPSDISEIRCNVLQKTADLLVRATAACLTRTGLYAFST